MVLVAQLGLEQVAINVEGIFHYHNNFIITIDQLNAVTISLNER
jgi:hypothetical protein